MGFILVAGMSVFIFHTGLLFTNPEGKLPDLAWHLI
jgi:hypothetical protein